LRRGYSAALYQGTIYIFGGRSNFEPEQFASIINKAEAEQKYAQLKKVADEGGTYYHEPMSALANKLVLNDVWGYNITNNTWFMVIPEPYVDNLGAVHHHLSPHHWHGHRAAVWDDIMCIFGGYYDPNEYYQDTWRFNLTSKVWLRKHIDGTTPSKRYQYGLAMWNKTIVIFGGYGADCTLRDQPARLESWYAGEHGYQSVLQGQHVQQLPGLYCEPSGVAYYLGDTWHHSMNTCPNGCVRNGTCHYGSCVCGKGRDGLDCSNYTCPDCTAMNGLPTDQACEVWDVNWNPVVFLKNPDPVKPVTEHHHALGGAGISVYLANSSIRDGNCHYEYGMQKKIRRHCSLQGYCNAITGHCECRPMFTNFDCSYKACPHQFCNFGGQCLLRGWCVCDYAYFGNDCGINFACPNDCSFQVNMSLPCSSQVLRWH